MCDRDTIQFVMFTLWMFTFVATSRGSLYDSIAFLLCCVAAWWQIKMFTMKL